MGKNAIRQCSINRLPPPADIGKSIFDCSIADQEWLVAGSDRPAGAARRRSDRSFARCPLALVRHPPPKQRVAYHGRMNKPYFVRAEWDAEAAVWVATSDDVPGLVTEAETIEALDAKLKSMVPELLEANGCMPADGQVAVELLARRFSVALPAAA